MNLLSKANKRLVISILNRKLPMTTLHWRYFFPGAVSALRIQRTIFFRQNQQYTIFLRVGAWAFLQLKWWSYCAPKAIYRAYKENSHNYVTRAQKAPWLQTVDLFSLAYVYSAPPKLYYTMELYHYSKSDWCCFVFDFQTPIWHSALSETGVDLSYLHDKHLFSEYMQQAGIKTIPSLVQFERDLSSGTTESHLSDYTWYDELPSNFFCKPVIGSQSQGCLRVSKSELDHKINVESLADGLSLSHIDLAQLRAVLNSRDYLIQPTLRNAGSLVKILGHKLSVFRIVTMKSDTDFHSVQAYVECKLLGEQQPLISILLDPNTGSCSFEPSFYGDEQCVEIVRRLPLLNSWVEAHWHTLSELCTTAHKCFEKVFSIGWDVAYTEQGPILVEGNTHWALELHQALEREPLLRSTRAKLIEKHLQQITV